MIGFGNYAKQLEKKINDIKTRKHLSLMLGGIAVIFAIMPFLLVVFLIRHNSNSLYINVFDIVIVYFCIGMQSLKQHAQLIYQSLNNKNLSISRQKVAMIVSRDTDKMSEKDISRATIESVLENGSDAIFAPIFFYLIAGIPGIIGYRLINTLDAMWGYKTPRFKNFGYTAAKLDDLLNFIPARLTALSYAIAGNWKNAIYCWKTQANKWVGVNPGVVMATGSGALDIKLGGGDFYHGKYLNRPKLGLGNEAKQKDILRALTLLNRVLWLWLLVLFIINLFFYL